MKFKEKIYISLAFIIPLFSGKMLSQETAQNEAETNSISVIANWYKNDTFYYRTISSTYFYEGDNVKDSTRFTNILRLIVRDSTEKNYNLEAQIMDDPMNKPISVEMNEQTEMCIPSNFKLILKYTTDERGVLEKYDNLEEVKSSIKTVMPLFDKIFLTALKTRKGIEGKEAGKLLPILRESLMDDEKIMQNFFWSNEMLHTNYGLNFNLDNTVEFKDTTDASVPFSGKNITFQYPMDCAFVASVDSENIINLELTQILDNESCGELGLKTLLKEEIFTEKMLQDKAVLSGYKDGINSIKLNKVFTQCIGNDGILLYAKSDNYVKNKNEDKSMIKELILLNDDDEIDKIRKLFK
jgi:hypothetical protein